MTQALPPSEWTPRKAELLLVGVLVILITAILYYF